MDHYPLLASLATTLDEATTTEATTTSGGLPGTYGGVRFSKETTERLVQLQKDLDIPHPLEAGEFHTTLMYSKHIPDYEAMGEIEEFSEPDSFKIEIWKSGSGKKNLAVLTYECDWLQDRHDHLMDIHAEHATWDHDDFLPHVTLSYDVGDWTPEDASIEMEPLEIVEEYTEELDPDW